MLTLLASFAQEESRSISENCKWGIRKRYQNGTIGTKYRRLYGYQHDGEEWQIIEEEAEIIRVIYRLHLEGKSLAEIVRAVNEAGARTITDKDFSYQQVEKILTNEFYCGDRRLQKTFVEDPISKRKVPNKGELPQYYIKDDHPAVIARDTFRKAQEVLAENKRYRKEHIIPKYPFSSKITCSACGNHYNRHKGKPKKDGTEPDFWYCSKSKLTGVHCDGGKCWLEKDLEKASVEVMGTEDFDPMAFAEQVKEITTFPDGVLEFSFFGGEKRTWQRPPKVRKTKKFVNQGLRPKQTLDGYIICGKCGRRFGRTKCTNMEGTYNMWRCRSKTSGKESCGNVNYRESEIKNAFCDVIGAEEFDDGQFKAAIRQIIIQDGGDIDFHFLDGTVRKVKNLKFLPGKHRFTVTEAFADKIRCRCGCEYRLVTERDRYAYWKCVGKGRDYMGCTAQDYTDYQLREISAYLMGTEEFDEPAFTEQVERITAVENGLVYTFKDGRNKTWRRML